MGTSTDGILFFGFTFFNPDEDDRVISWLEDEDQDWEQFVAVKLGAKPPACEYKGNEAEYSAFWAERRRLVAETGCEIDSHCSGEYPIWFVCVKRHSYSANRG